MCATERFLDADEPSSRLLVFPHNALPPTVAASLTPMLVVSFNLIGVLAYLEPWIEGNVLASQRKASGYPYELNVIEAEKLGWLLKKRFGFEPEAYYGVTKVCYRHASAVIKIPIHESYADQTAAEIDYINENFSKAERQHFPYTLHAGNGIAIQERCRLDATQYMKRIVEINCLADSLHVEDIHVGNVGFALDDINIVKFIDVQTFAMLNDAQAALTTLEILNRRTSNA